MKHLYVCFPEGRYKAVTLSYDDGRTEDRKLVEILNRYGIKGTFHLNSGYLAGKDQEEENKYGRRISEEEIPGLYKGHEVACHTVFHPTMERTPMPQLIRQVVEDRTSLEKEVGYPVRGFSYPNGSYSEEIKSMLKNLGIAYARIVGDSECFNMPKDFLEWKPTCHHNHRLLELTDEFIARDKDQLLSLMYVWGHSYEFTRDGNWDLIEKFAERISGKQDIWYATNIEIVQYMEAFKRLIFTADCGKVYNPSVQPVWLNVDGTVIEVGAGMLKELARADSHASIKHPAHP